MKSKTKYPVTQAQLQAIFHSANLGDIQHSAPMTDGWYNNVLGVKTREGEFVIKIAPEPRIHVLTHEKDLLKQELRFIELLHSHGVSVPNVHFSDCTKTLIPCDYFIMEKLPGKRLDHAKQNADAQKASMLAAFHAIEGEGFGYEQMGLEANWHLAFRKMVQALVDDCASFGKRCPMGEKLLVRIDRHRELLEAVPSVLVNFDLHAKNLFWHAGELTVIDLERCFWGDRMGDFVLGGLPKNATPEERIRRELLSCYLAVVAYTEKYSRYRPWNATWWADVAMQKYFWKSC